MILTVDISRLTEAKDAGVTQPVVNETINKDIPDHFRDPGRQLVRPDDTRPASSMPRRSASRRTTSTYEELRRPQVEGQDLHPRRASTPIMSACFASMIAHHGEAEAENG